MKSKLIQLIAVTAILTFYGPVYSTVLVVDPAAGGDYLNLETAVAVAVDGDVIEFVDGTHFISRVEITSSLTLRSASEDASSCTIVGDSENAGLVISDPSDSGMEVGLQGLGFSEASVGFASCHYQIQGCRFNLNNNPELEYGLYILSSTGTIETSTFDHTKVVYRRSSLIVRACPFSNSKITPARDFYGFESSSFILEDCSFTGSSKVWISLALSAVFERCTFSENVVQEGLLFVTHIGELSITSCLFSNNQLGSGPALNIGIFGGEVTIEDSTFHDNSSTGQTAGIRSMWFPEDGHNISCENVDFDGNIAPNGSPDAFIDDGCSINFNCCEIDEANIGGAGQANITFDGCTVANKRLGLGDLKALYR